jgi:hypothetical protein
MVWDEMKILTCSVLICFLTLEACGSLAQNSASLSNVVGNIAEAPLIIKEANVPRSLEALFCPESSYLARCKIAQDLKSNLQYDEVAALLTFIHSDPQNVGLSRDHFNSVGDKVINVLERQQEIPPALVDTLMVMFRDEQGDFAWRDYCVQHLGSLYATDAAIGRREHIRQAWDEAMRPEVRMAGTVVLALRRNVGEDGISTEYVTNKAGEVALDDTQPDSSRLTAIQVAAELGNRDMLPLAHEIVESHRSIPFRMSAMATIGILGNTSDLSLLEKYTSSSDMRLRLASRAAIEKIEARVKE